MTDLHRNPRAAGTHRQHPLDDAPTADADPDWTTAASAPSGGGPVALDGLAHGIDHLDAIVVVALDDGRTHAAWVRADAGFTAAAVAVPLRDAYRSAVAADRALHARDVDAMVTLESARATLHLVKIRGCVVAVAFEAGMPLGMSRFIAGRIAQTLEPELPYAAPPAPLDAPTRLPTMPPTARPAPGLFVGGAPTRSPPAASAGPPPPPREGAAAARGGTLAFHADASPADAAERGATRWSPSRPPPARATPSDLDRARRLIAYLEQHAPEPHVARLRLALRSGLPPVALDHPEALAADALVLIETAVEEILGVDRTVLRSLP